MGRKIMPHEDIPPDGTRHGKSVVTRKRLVWAIVLFFLLTCTPLGQYVIPHDTLTVRGILPQNIHIEAIAHYYTTSPLCRDFSMGSGRFTAFGRAKERVEAAPDASGRFELEIPVEKNSLWCNWIGKGVSLIAIAPPEVKGYSPRSVDIGSVGFDKKSKSASATIQCVDTYYIFHRGDNTTGQERRILCRNINIPYPENPNSQEYPPIRIPWEAEEMTLHMLLEPGPVYDLHKGPAHYWREFDATRNSSTGILR